MRKPVSLFILLIAIGVAISQQRNGTDSLARKKAYELALQRFSEAERLARQANDQASLQQKADEKYQEALQGFNQLLNTESTAPPDAIQLISLVKTGYIHYYFDSTSSALQDYSEAIRLQAGLPGVADSFLFAPYLYSGAIYYSQDKFDTALSFYKKAAAIADRYALPLEGAPRLYNRLGAMYYETGNYRQAQNYFEKALALTPPSERTLQTNYRINIAALLVKLEEYEQAKKIYTSLLPSPGFDNEILHNLAIISLRQSEPATALSYLRLVNYDSSKKNIELYFNKAVAFTETSQPDSARYFLQAAKKENEHWNGKRKNTAYGLILNYEADELVKKRQFAAALATYQQAILQFDQAFNDTGLSRNPEKFDAVYAYINLFNTLTEKANAFENWYQEEPRVEFLKNALSSYQSAFRLAAFVEKTYDSDEARLFLGRIKHTVHAHPIDISLQLYRLTQDKNYLEEAYYFDQLNKAAVLAVNVQEHEWRKEKNTDNQLVQREQALKTSITRYALQASGLTDTTTIQQLHATLRDLEIELGKVQERLNADPAIQRTRNLEQVPEIKTVQRQLDNSTTILSYHLSETELLILFIAQGRFGYHQVALTKKFYDDISGLKASLHNTDPQLIYQGQPMATALYEVLIAPIAAQLSHTTRLVIIPDDELHYLPFEALQDQEHHYLVERYAVQYLYSTLFLGSSENNRAQPGTLAFAPFSARDFIDSNGHSFRQLPASKEEIAGWSGTQFLDAAATRENFLRTKNKHGILHLATHASVNNSDPARSYIVFYPGATEYKLYAGEIANLKLDSTRLVILSACETGDGQLIKGEGLLSLSRAFAYAGCPNIIASLWKAEDRTTAFLVRQLHHYLGLQYTRDRALRQARLDLLRSNAIDPRFKTPNYWAHLIYIGDYEKKQPRSNAIWFLLTIVVAGIIYLVITRKKNPPATHRRT